MLKILENPKIKPEVLVITPLFTGHKILKDTKIRLKRNKISYCWVSYESNLSTAGNFSAGLAAYREKYPVPKYIIMIDRDILPGRHMLDKMKETLDRSQDDIAYTYVDFAFKGSVNREFVNLEYDPVKLMEGNYISSNSMIKLKHLDEVGGIVTDDKYKRLLDWVLWLKFLSCGFHGVRTPGAYFVAIADENSISAGTAQEYKLKHLRVYEDIIKPMLEATQFEVDSDVLRV